MSEESDAIVTLTSMLNGQMDDLNDNVIPALEDSVRDLDGSMDTQLTAIRAELTNLKTSAVDITTKLDTIATNITSLETKIESKMDEVITTMQDMLTTMNAFITAFGDLATQGLTTNIQDIRDDTREGLLMSKEALRRAGLPSRISGSH